MLIYLNQDDNAKRHNAQRYYLPKGIIKNYSFIINGKNFYDQLIDFYRKWYEEIRKLTIGQGEDYTTGCLWDYDYIKNHDRLIAVDLSRQKGIKQIELVGQQMTKDYIIMVMLQRQVLSNLCLF